MTDIQIPDARWLAVPGHPDYEVSDLGEVRSYKVGHRGGAKPFVKTGEPYVLKQKIGKDGYPRVNLDLTWHLTHRIVALAFLGSPPTSRHEVAHNDGDPGNPSLTNLRWATPTENQSDKVAHGTTNRGERSGTAKLTTTDVLSIRFLRAQGAPQAELAAAFGVRPNTISRIVNHKRWAHV